MSADFLTAMARSSHVRAMRARARAGELRSLVSSAAPPIRLRVEGAEFGIIAEIKLASPAVGRLVPKGASDDYVVGLAAEYERGGARCVSVLTTPEGFDGSIDHLTAVARAVKLPVMRKDFLVDPIQVLEARAHGASGVLLIARLLGSERLTEMVEAAAELAMFSLVELFDKRDVETTAAVFDREILVGVNARNLADLTVDRERLADLGPVLPDTLTRVAESGVETAGDVARLATIGYRMALVGTALVRSPAPAHLVATMADAGRAALIGASS